MKKELYFDYHSGMRFSALTEEGKLVELGIENEEHREIVGNIYKGQVVNVIDSMNAAFINCGLERNCYLSLQGGEIFANPSKYDAKIAAKKSCPLHLKAGDEVIVQVVKNPRGSKGAKVTTKLSFVGKNLIFLPETDFLGISHKISEAELKDNLLFMVDGMRGKGNGLIVRTAAPYATVPRLQAEVKYLRNLYQSVLEKNKTSQCGELLYREGALPIRVMRDSFNEDIDRIIVGEPQLYEQMRSLIKLRSDFPEENVEVYDGEEDMFSHYGIAKQIKQLSESTVPLPNGGDIVIERTEALTVVDVNTKKFIGDENLEDTVYATNIAAAREIARQVRLRDVGGIVVVDFIDMLDEHHRKSVADELAQCLAHDRVKCKVLPMNEFCLVEFTRKCTTNGVAAQLLQPCPHCRLNGYILANEFTVCLLRAELLNRLSRGAQTVVVDMNRDVMEFMIAHHMLQSDVQRWKERKIYLVPHRTYHEERFVCSSYRAGEPYELPDDAVLFSYD